MALYFDREPIAGSDALVERYGTREFDSPTRSTVPLLSLLRHGGDIWQRIVAELGMRASETAVHLEYTVAPPRGTGRPSHTDAMLIAGERARAVEAKWTEPAYATVQIWLNAGSDQSNREAVFAGWLSLLQPHAARELRLADFNDVTYQMVHRAASACAAGRSPGLAYLQFTPGPDASPADVHHLRDGLARLADALGCPAGFPLRLIEVETRPTPAFEGIRTAPKAFARTSEMIRTALCGEESLFTFPDYRMHHIA